MLPLLSMNGSPSGVPLRSVAWRAGRLRSWLHCATPRLTLMTICAALLTACWTSSSAGCITMLGMVSVAFVRKNGLLSRLPSVPESGDTWIQQSVWDYVNITTAVMWYGCNRSSESLTCIFLQRNCIFYHLGSKFWMIFMTYIWHRFTKWLYLLPRTIDHNSTLKIQKNASCVIKQKVFPDTSIINLQYVIK